MHNVENYLLNRKIWLVVFNLFYYTIKSWLLVMFRHQDLQMFCLNLDKY